MFPNNTLKSISPYVRMMQAFPNIFFLGLCSFLSHTFLDSFGFLARQPVLKQNHDEQEGTAHHILPEWAEGNASSAQEVQNIQNEA